MLSQKDRRIVEVFRRHVERIVPVLDLRVYDARCSGSSHGNGIAETDLDQDVEIETTTPEVRERISAIAWEVGFQLNRRISPLIVSSRQLEQGAIKASPLIMRARQRGVTVV